MHISPKSLSATRPIDTAYLEESKAFWRAAVDEQIAALAPGTRDRVLGVCAELGLCVEATHSVLGNTCDLIDFERHGRDNVLTTAQRFEAIKYVRDAALGIAEAIGDLSAKDRITLLAGVSAARRDLELRGEGFTSPLVFSAWAMAAQRLLDASPDEEGKSGRRRLRAEYSRFVGSLAHAFDTSGLPVGRGGAFERLCVVVFEVAGVRATPEGAIRFYLSERKKLALNEPENSGTEHGE